MTHHTAKQGADSAGLLHPNSAFSLPYPTESQPSAAPDSFQQRQAELEHFVAQTRARLGSLSMSLAQYRYSQSTISQQANVSQQTSVLTGEPTLPSSESSSAAQQVDAVSRDVLEISEEINTFVEAAESNSQLNHNDDPPLAHSPQYSLRQNVQPQDSPAQDKAVVTPTASSAAGEEMDPMARLDAIKHRLANQIKNA